MANVCKNCGHTDTEHYRNETCLAKAPEGPVDTTKYNRVGSHFCRCKVYVHSGDTGLEPVTVSQLKTVVANYVANNGDVVLLDGTNYTVTDTKSSINYLFAPELPGPVSVPPFVIQNGTIVENPSFPKALKDQVDALVEERLREITAKDRVPTPVQAGGRKFR